MVFGLAAPAIDILVEPASVAFAQIGDDEAGVRSFRARFDARPIRRACEAGMTAICKGEACQCGRRVDDVRMFDAAGTDGRARRDTWTR